MLASYRLCRCRLVFVMLLLVDYMLCGGSVVIAISLRESFRLCRYNALTSVCCHYNSLSFETVKVKCAEFNKISHWFSALQQKFSCGWLFQDVQMSCGDFDSPLLIEYFKWCKWGEIIFKRDDNWKFQVVPLETHSIRREFEGPYKKFKILISILKNLYIKFSL